MDFASPGAAVDEAMLEAVTVEADREDAAGASARPTPSGPFMLPGRCATMPTAMSPGSDGAPSAAASGRFP